MANDDLIASRGGLWPVLKPYGSVRLGLYKLTTSAVAVYLGQPMDLEAGGGVAPAGVTDDDPILGPVMGFVDADKVGGIPTDMTALSQGAYLPASKNAWCLIADDPNQLFSIQEDTGGTALTQADVGMNADLIVRGSSGNNLTGVCTFELDRSTTCATQSGQLQILGLVDTINSDGTPNGFGNYAKLLVRIHLHRLGPALNRSGI